VGNGDASKNKRTKFKATSKGSQLINQHTVMIRPNIRKKRGFRFVSELETLGDGIVE
jgi:hypothetical protein